MSTFAIATLGCKVNMYETQGYIQALEAAGYQGRSFKEIADVYIINTCAVTNTAASKSRQKIHQAQALNPEAIIVVVGCYVQMASEELKQDLGIDILIGSDRKDQLVPLLQQARKHHQQSMVHDMRSIRVFEALPVSQFQHQTRAYLKIQDGCNQFCSYCIIPYTRGAERSLPMAEVLQSAYELVAHGHLEIVLSGIHTGRYGGGLGYSLSDLLKEMIQSIPKLERIRISSIEMNEVSDDLLDYMMQEPKIARHLHIPLQSANDQVLALMNRPYTMQQFMKRIEDIRNRMPDISISSDVIVGFPQESEEAFHNTVQNIEALQLSFLHVFPYSKRDGTKAATMPGHVDNKTKKQRANTLISLSNRLALAYKDRFIGKDVEVLFEKAEAGYLIGHTSEYIEVHVLCSSSHVRKMKRVHITTIKDGVVYATLKEMDS